MESELKLAGDGLKKSLLQAARKCDMETMGNLLNESKNIDLSFADEAGKTLLHHCTSAGDKENALLLLQRGAPPNKPDNMGLTPIHYAAKRDYLDIVEALVTYGANVNAVEMKTGQTALHITVAKNYLSTSQFLLFSGADTSLKDKQGKQPIALCRSKEMRNLLAGFSQGTKGGLREIQLQTTDIQGGTKTYCDRLDLFIDYKDGSPDDTFSLMCRKQAIDYSDEDFSLSDRDEVFSDVINYRLGRKGRQTKVTLSVPIFGEVERREELVLKGNRGFSALVESVKSEAGWKYYAIVTVDMSLLDAFVIVSCPMKEVFLVNNESTILKSKVNPGVEIELMANSFDQDTSVILEITDAPSAELFATDDMDGIYSCTCFCSVRTDNNTGPKHDVLFRLPLPGEYGQGGRLCAFSSNVYEIWDVSPENWSLLDKNVKVSNKKVEFSSRSFSIKTCVETKKETDPTSLTQKVHAVFEKAQKRDYTVMFLVMSKLNDNFTFTLVVECVKVEKAENRKNYWLQQGYMDQKPTQSVWINAHSRNKYRCKISKSLQHTLDSGDSDEVYLQFHARRINYQCFTFNVVDKSGSVSGDIQIFQVQPKTFKEENRDLAVRSDKNEKNPTDKLLTSVSVQLSKELHIIDNVISSNIPPMSPVMNEMSGKSRTSLLSEHNDKSITPKLGSIKAINFKEEARMDPTWKGFTNDSFLKSLLDQLDEEWYKIVILLGIPFKEVNTVLHIEEATQEQKINHFLLRWRDSSRPREDLGMSELITAVSKGGRRDICTSILLELKDWYEKDDNKKTKFWRWVNKAFMDSDLYNPGDYPRPMSDAFLVLLTQCIENPIFEVAVPLGLSRADVQHIREDPMLESDEQQLLWIFAEARDRKSSKIDALRCFLDAMNEVKMTDGKKWIIMASENWLESNKKNEDTFVKEIESVIRPIHLIS